MMKKLFLLITLSALFIACQNTAKSGKNETHNNLTIVVKSTEYIGNSGVAATPAQRAISKLIIAIYDKYGNYINKTDINGSGETVSHTFSNIESGLFPIKVVAIANIGGPWELSGVTDWSGTKANILDQLLIVNGSNNKVLKIGATPLPMYGHGEANLKNNTLNIELTRALSIVNITNRSTAVIDHITLTNLNNSVGTYGSFTPSTTNGGYSFTESNLTFGKDQTLTYYLMPTVSNEAQIEFGSGLVTKSETLNTLAQNTYQSVEITINDNSEIDITIGVQDFWEDDNLTDIK